MGIFEMYRHDGYGARLKIVILFAINMALLYGVAVVGFIKTVV